MEIEQQRINPNKIAVARKWSAVEWEMHQTGMSESEFLESNRRLGVNMDEMFDSHLDQKVAFKKFLEPFEVKPKIFEGESLRKGSLRDGALCIDPQEGSGRNYKLTRGDKGVINFTDTPLRIVGPA